MTAIAKTYVYAITIIMIIAVAMSVLRLKSSGSEINKTNTDDENFNICRVSIVDIELNNNEMHVGDLYKSEEEMFICEIVDTEYGIISDYFLQVVSFPQRVIEQNKERLVNQTWFIQYVDEQVIKGKNEYGTPFLNFNTTNTNAASNNTDGEGNNIITISHEEVEQIIMDRATTLSTKNHLRNGNRQNDNNDDDTNHTNKINDRNLMTSKRNLANTFGEKTVVIILAGDVLIKEEDAYEYIFGANNSLSSQIDGCSSSQMTLVPHSTHPIVRIDLYSDASAYYFPDIVSESIPKIGRRLGASWETGLLSQADYYIYIVPDDIDTSGTSSEHAVAWAPMFGYYSLILESWITSVQPIMHEFGHMLGNPHAHEMGREYGDTTTVMGMAHRNSKLCFNGQNLWRMQWYQDRRKEITSLEILEGSSNNIDSDSNNNNKKRQQQKPLSIMVTLAFYGDYRKTMNNPNQNVVLKVGDDLYLTYNRRKGINEETQEYPDMLLIVQEKINTINPSFIPRLNIYSDLIGVLQDDGDQFTISNHINSNNDDGENLDLIIEICDHHIETEENNDLPDYLTIAIGTNDSMQDGDTICH